MTVEQDLLLALTNPSPTPTSAGDRVYALLRPQDQATPAITYQRISSEPVADFDGDNGLENPRIQLSCWATTYGRAKTLGREVRAALAASALFSYVSTDRDDYEPETRLYRVILDVMPWGTS